MIIDIKLYFFVIFVDVLILVICNNGFEGVFIYNILVLGLIYCLMFLILVVLIKFMFILKWVNILVNVWYVLL